MSTLSVTILQADLHWHDAAANREMFRRMIDEQIGRTDLIVLPEMFTTGFSMDAAALAEPMDGETIRWLSETASSVNASICGSLIIEENGNYYNRFICISPAGELTSYDKRHLFRLADEHDHYSAGTTFVTFSIGDWRICPMVCYDLRFPVWSRNKNCYDLLLYVANWPDRRHLAWQTLLRARAIENLSYLAGVNRIGVDGNQLPYAGGSAIINFLGQDVANLHDTNGAASATLDLDELRKFRARFPFDVDADDFSIGR
jgi:predicted amidohydrolase